MMRVKNLIAAVSLLLVAAAPSFGADRSDETVDKVELGQVITPKDTTRQRIFRNRLIVPKGSWQCGLSVMYADFSSSDSEYMLMLQDVSARASMLRLAPEAAYSFADNHAIGARFQYTNTNGMVDTATADLLGNLSLSLDNLNALSRSMSGCIFQRTYFGLDKRGRVGLYWDYVLGFTRTKSQFYAGESTSSYSIKKKIHLGFAPGIVYFPMNNISIQASISLADISYTNVKGYEADAVVGTRHAWNARARLNVLDLNFGITVHL